MSKHTHWCPSGKCGKSVIYTFVNNKVKRRYRCTRCNKLFTAKELEVVN